MIAVNFTKCLGLFPQIITFFFFLGFPYQQNSKCFILYSLQWSSNAKGQWTALKRSQLEGKWQWLRKIQFKLQLFFCSFVQMASETTKLLNVQIFMVMTMVIDIMIAAVPERGDAEGARGRDHHWRQGVWCPKVGHRHYQYNHHCHYPNQQHNQFNFCCHSFGVLFPKRLII